MSVPEKIRRLREGPFAALTAYDYPGGRILDEAGVDLILVGDSLGMVFAGLPDTTGVTLDQMLYHTAVVRRGVRNALLIADLPYRTYESPGQAMENARRLADAGADGVKLEGGTDVADQVAAICEAGIPLLGHIGMLPQQIREEKGYRKKGGTRHEADRLLEDARVLEAHGAFAMVLEGIVPAVARRITETVEIPTIGIGSGAACDAPIAVLADVIGSYPWFVPPFATPRGDVAGTMRQAVEAYVKEAKKA